MPGTRADAEKFCRNWAGRGDENQDTQRFWIGLLQGERAIFESGIRC